METVRCTMAQALVEYMKLQYIERDGQESPFFAGAWGIFGHGSVAGVGQALHETEDFRYYLCRNEQAMVHTAIAYAKMKNRLSAFACTSSIGPGATNMVTGAATATLNRIPVLLLPGDIFARRNVAPVLQQLECEHSQDTSVNDSFKCVSRYWDRINRPEQLPYALPEVMRVLTSPSETGAVTLCLPQDVQAEAHDFPAEMFRRRVWRISRPLADRSILAQAAQWIRESEKPFIIAGGGVLYSQATDELASFCEQTGIAVGETQAGKGSLPYTHAQNLEAMGVTGTPGANLMARDADLVIDELTASVKFDEQDGAGVHWVAALKARLHGLERGPVHHFERARDESRANYGGDGPAGLLYGVKDCEQRDDGLWGGKQLHGDLGGDAQCAFGANEDATKVVACRFGHAAPQA